MEPGILTKTWLFGARSKSIGGFYSFDPVDNAKRFALNYFPTINVKVSPIARRDIGPEFA